VVFILCTVEICSGPLGRLLELQTTFLACDYALPLHRAKFVNVYELDWSLRPGALLPCSLSLSLDFFFTNEPRAHATLYRIISTMLTNSEMKHNRLSNFSLSLIFISFPFGCLSIVCLEIEEPALSMMSISLQRAIRMLQVLLFS